MIGNLAYANGQVAATTAATIASVTQPAQSHRINLTFVNVGAVAESLVLTVENNGGTARRIFGADLEVGEQVVIEGLALDALDVLKAATTTAESVDYRISKASDNASFAITTYDAAGAIKTAQSGATTIQGLRTTSSSAAAITAARVLTLADSGGVFNIDQDAAFDIDVPDPTTGPGCRYQFVISDAGANTVTITCAGAATFIGSITIDAATIVATGSTLTFVSGTAVVGDNIEIISVSTTLYLVRAFASAAGGITIA